MSTCQLLRFVAGATTYFVFLLFVLATDKNNYLQQDCMKGDDILWCNLHESYHRCENMFSNLERSFVAKQDITFAV